MCKYCNILSVNNEICVQVKNKPCTRRIGCMRLISWIHPRGSRIITIRVNYWDRPARYITISAVQDKETAERFGTWKEETNWFLKNRTYVDDATEGACNKEAAFAVSQDMEDISAIEGSISRKQS
jgi:hypothetical protein